MKTIIKYLLPAFLLASIFVSCDLDTEPTGQVSGTTIFASEAGAQTAVDGCYALLWREPYVTANAHHAYGHQSTMLAQDLMSDDLVQTVFNWYGWDYDLSYTSRININTASRNYNVWNMYYTTISNANYIIKEIKDRAVTDGYRNILAQAYALRAFCYFELIQGYQKTYLGHENDPGVPLYTEPTTAGTQGKGRGKVSDVYTLINGDIQAAITLFNDSGRKKQAHSSHIDYYVAKGFQARIALVQGDYLTAYDAAGEALGRLSKKVLPKGDIFQGFSDKALASNLWVMDMSVSDQKQVYASLYCALDPTAGTNGYGYAQPKCISNWLYERVNDPRFKDARIGWWKAPGGSAVAGPDVPYINHKRLARVAADWVGDFIFMRGEEMLLIQAEAKARLGSSGEARSLLEQLAAERLGDVAAYSAYLSTLPEATALSADALANTNTIPQNVLEEVLLQRRIELWGELGRIKDILRLKQGYNRNYPGTNHVELLINVNTQAESGAFLFKIPQTEFDGNTSISSSEQNPIE